MLHDIYLLLYIYHLDILYKYQIILENNDNNLDNSINNNNINNSINNNMNNINLLNNINNSININNNNNMNNIGLFNNFQGVQPNNNNLIPNINLNNQPINLSNVNINNINQDNNNINIPLIPQNNIGQSINIIKSTFLDEEEEDFGEPMTFQQIDNLPIINYPKKEVYDEKCELCEFPLCFNDRVTKLEKCQHIFHKECLGNFLMYRKGSKCPICKISLI